MFTQEEKELAIKINQACIDYVKCDLKEQEARIISFNFLYIAKLKLENKELKNEIRNLSKRVSYLENMDTALK